MICLDKTGAVENRDEAYHFMRILFNNKLRYKLPVMEKNGEVIPAQDNSGGKEQHLLDCAWFTTIVRLRARVASTSAATLDSLVAVGTFPLDEITPGKALLFPVVKMLSKMTECPEVVRAKMAGYVSQGALVNGQQKQESRL